MILTTNGAFAACLVTTALLSAVALKAGPPPSNKGKPQPPPSPRAACRAKFADNVGDGIRSDGRGAYVNGVDGVVCEVSILEEAGLNPAITLNPQKSRTRSINFIFTPTFAVRDTSNLIAGVDLSMFAGETVTARAHFYSALHSSQAANVEFSATDPPSTNVAVTRVGDKEWKIEAPLVVPSQFDPGLCGVDLLTGQDDCAGHDAIIPGNGPTAYHMPFTLKVCLTTAGPGECSF